MPKPTKNKKRGRGKPAFFDVPMRRKNVMLDEETITKALKLGNGNLSDGIRKAVAKA